MRPFAKILFSSPVLLLVVAYRLGIMDFVTGGEALAPIPGFIGRWWRERWYRLTLAACGDEVTFDWMAVIKSPLTSVGRRVFIGPFCWIGRASIGDECMLGGHVTILSGGRHHRIDRTDLSMIDQPGRLEMVTVGRDVWIGNRSVIMADVAEGSVVGSGGVVTRTYEPYMILGGVPARVLRSRNQATS